MKKITILMLSLIFCFASIASFADGGIEVRNASGSTSDVPFILKGKGHGRGSDGIKGKKIITVGVGFNLSAAALEVRYALSSYYRDTLGGYGIVTPSSTPLINVMFDYGVASKFSVGIGLGYQSLKMTWSDAFGSSSGFGFVDTWTRIAIAARADYHIVTTEKISLYTGARVGYNIYSFSTTANSTNAPLSYSKANLGVVPTAIAVQAVMGFSFFFTPNIGANVEAGLAYGGPYYSAVGLALKF
jgi:opacity protein-like surface antigen